MSGEGDERDRGGGGKVEAELYESGKVIGQWCKESGWHGMVTTFIFIFFNISIKNNIF